MAAVRLPMGADNKGICRKEDALKVELATA